MASEAGIGSAPVVPVSMSDSLVDELSCVAVVTVEVPSVDDSSDVCTDDEAMVLV